MREVEIMRAIQLALGARRDVRVWRSNTGVGRALTDPSSVVAFGLPGAADLSGIVSPSGRRLEVEVKSATGRLSPVQRAFGEMVQRFGGIYIVARSVEQAIAELELALGGR